MLELEVTKAIVQVLQDLAIPYCVGGSFASAIHGEARSTRDVDILVALRPNHVRAFIDSLTPAFFVQPQDVLDAVELAPSLRDTPRQRASFSMIHQASFFKADMFVASGRPFEQSEFTRAIAIEIAPGNQLVVASPEDTILAKLEWYRIGNEVSDRQWRDILSIVVSNSDLLDLTYLRIWAATLAVADLLERALGDEQQSDAQAEQLPLF